MNGRAIAIGSGLLVAAAGTALVGSASAAAEGGARRAHHVAARAHSSVDLPSVDPAMKARTHAIQVRAWTKAVNDANAARWYAAVAADIARQHAATSSHRSSSNGSGSGVLGCIKQRESRGQYGAVNTSSGAAGAYQFMPSTWNNTARSAGRADLVGVNPANASAADQDAMAQHLLATQGLGPWGGGCG